jgi:hypothetical protein
MSCYWCINSLVARNIRVGRGWPARHLPSTPHLDAWKKSKLKKKGNYKILRIEVFTAVTMKNAVFWDVAPCTSCVNRRFGGTYRLHLQGRKIRENSLQPPADAGSSIADFSALKMEAIRSSETSVHTICTRRHIPEDEILLYNTLFTMNQNYCC